MPTRSIVAAPTLSTVAIDRHAVAIQRKLARLAKWCPIELKAITVLIDDLLLRKCPREIILPPRPPTLRPVRH